MMTYEQLSTERLDAMQAEVLMVNTENGWFEEGRAFEEGIGLIHSEISEALEAYRDHGMEDMTRRLCKVKSGDWHDPNPHLCKPEGVGSEMADVLIRLLDEAYRQGITLRPGVTWCTLEGSYPTLLAHLHLHTSKWMDKVLRSRAHSESPTAGGLAMETGANMVLAHLQAICAKFEINLEHEYERKVAYNATRGHRHGGKRL